MRESPTVRDFLCGALTDGAHVIVDLSECDYLDSTFLGCLVKLQRVGTKRWFQVVADDAARKRLFAATQLDGYFSFIPQSPKSTTPFAKLDISPLSDHELGQHMMEAHAALGDIPSEFASRFKRIASQLMSELKQRDLDADNMADTVILPKQVKKT